MQEYSYVFVFVGMLVRVLLPWLVKLYQDNGEGAVEWNWKYLRSQLVIFAALAVALPIMAADLDSVADMTFQAAFTFGYAAADVGRLLDKLTEK